MRRGDIYLITNDGQTGCEMANNRPALIVSNDMCNTHSPIIQMVPLTCSKKKPLPTHVHVILDGRHSTVLCEHICAVDKSRVQAYKGHLDEAVMSAVDRALRIQLGLEGTT